LSSITIPSSVTSINSNAFYGIPNLSSTIVITPIPPTPSYAYTWFHNDPDNYYNNITFQDPNPGPGPIICFKEDTKILTNLGYVPIQDLKVGDLVKTVKHDYKPIAMIGYRDMVNQFSEDRHKDKLYVCGSKEYPEVFEELVITGCHSILVDEFQEDEQEKTLHLLGLIYVTDNKYRLPACVSKKTKPYDSFGKFTIYHISLLEIM
jgi:hypothetical protein